MHVFISRRTNDIPPIVSSTFLSDILKIIGTDSKYLEQNVKHSSAIYPSAIEPSGAAVLRT